MYLPNLRIKLVSPASPALQVDSLPPSHQGSPNGRILTVFNFQVKIYVFKKNNYHVISLNTTYMLKELLKYNNYKYSLWPFFTLHHFHFPMSLKYLGKYYFNFCILCHHMKITYLNFSFVEHVDKNFGKYMYP